MTEYGPSTYGERIAAAYDSFHAGHDPAAIDLLAELAGDGPALELGIGTGRLALPLAERGVPMHGVDASIAMVERLRAKSGGAEIPVTISDFTELALEERYSLVYVAFNTFFALLTQEDQLRCFRSVAAHLRPGGAFLIEAFVPDLTRFDRHQRLSVVRLDPEGLAFDASSHDPVSQVVMSHHVHLTEKEGVRLYPVRLRYAWPSELDLMARLAGLKLRDRWGGWDRRTFGTVSTSHVSIYGW